jgi:hypothetical protein
MFWVNIDTTTKTCTMHTADCINAKTKSETKLKGVGLLKRDGGWLSFGTFVQTEDYCKREFGPKGYSIHKDSCL